MWAVTPVLQPHRLNFTHHKPPILVAVSANSQPSRQSYSSPNKKQRRKLQKQEQDNQKERGAATTNQLSGLDVLWAMQKAAAEKNRISKTAKINRKRDGFVSATTQKEEEAVDYSNVKHFCIKSDWGPRLDHLEQLLKELSDAN